MIRRPPPPPAARRPTAPRPATSQGELFGASGPALPQPTQPSPARRAPPPARPSQRPPSTSLGEQRRTLPPPPVTTQQTSPAAALNQTPRLPPKAATGLAALRSSEPDDYDDEDYAAPEVSEAPKQAEVEADLEAKVRIRRVLYSAEDGYRVMLVTKGKDKFKVITNFAQGTEIGDEVMIRGKWGTSRGERVFNAVAVVGEMPRSAMGVVYWIKKSKIPGVGAATADALGKHFGVRLIDVVTQPEILVEADIPLEKAKAIAEAWLTNAMRPETVAFLAEHGLNSRQIKNVMEVLGETARQKIAENPWSLSELIEGVGFATADRIGAIEGHAKDSPLRMRAGLRHTLIAAKRDGHCGLPVDVLVDKAAMLLRQSRPIVQKYLNLALDGHAAILDEETGLAVSLKVRAVEQRVARDLARLLNCGAYERDEALEAIRVAEAQMHITLDPSQREAAVNALTHAVSVITGGPGTGKSTTQKVIVQALSNFQRDIALVAPTGRAAKRLAEVSGREASTCHRLLRVQEGAFVHDAQNQFPHNWLIVDEFSMVDIDLACSFIQAIASGSGLTIVGDVDQLPSVGAGQVLRDLIESGVIPTSRLEVVHRQGNDSAIVTAAHRVNNGLTPLPAEVRTAKGFKVMPIEEPEEILGKVISLLKDVLPARGVDPLRDVHVMTPMRPREIGVDKLNEAIKAALNPAVEDDPDSVTIGKTTYTVGDRIMQQRNDYSKGIFNGEVGFVCHVGHRPDEENGKPLPFIVVEYPEAKATYGKSDIEDIELAYATTVHKSQGCEAPVVIFAAHRSQMFMLRRNLFYTAITRAKQLCVVIGADECIERAAATIDLDRRYTGLAKRLQSEMAIEPELDEGIDHMVPAMVPGGFLQIDEP